MNITDTLMAPGNWQLVLNDETPTRIIRQVQAAIATYNTTDEAWDPVLDGQIVVFRAGQRAVPDLTNADYCGALYTQTGIRSFAGEGLASYLNRNNGIGRVSGSAPVSSTTQSLSDWIDDLIDNGITKGTVTLTGLSNVNAAWEYTVGARDMLDHVCNLAGLAEWRINPDGTLDAAATGDLFRSGAAMFSASAIGSRGASPTVIPATIAGYTLNAINSADGVIVIGSGEGASVNDDNDLHTSEVGYGLDGTRGSFTDIIDSPTLDATNTATVAASALSTRRRLHDTFRITTDQPTAYRLVDPGDMVYVHHPLFSHAGTPVVADGTNWQAVQARVTSMRYSLAPGTGVYLRRKQSGDATWVDLTEYVQFATKPVATFEVTTQPVRQLTAGEQQARRNLAVLERLLR